MNTIDKFYLNNNDSPLLGGDTFSSNIILLENGNLTFNSPSRLKRLLPLLGVINLILFSLLFSDFGYELFTLFLYILIPSIIIFYLCANVKTYVLYDTTKESFTKYLELWSFTSSKVVSLKSNVTGFSIQSQNFSHEYNRENWGYQLVLVTNTGKIIPFSDYYMQESIGIQEDMKIVSDYINIPYFIPLEPRLRLSTTIYDENVELVFTKQSNLSKLLHYFD